MVWTVFANAVTCSRGARVYWSATSTRHVVDRIAQEDRLGDYRLEPARGPGHVGPDAALEVEGRVAAAALIGQVNFHPRHQERQLPQSLGQGVEFKSDRVPVFVAEYLPVRLEADAGPGDVLVPNLASRADAVLGDPAEVLLKVIAPVARDLHFKVLGKGVYDRNPDAVQAARNLVGVGVEFAPGVQVGHDHFQGRNALVAVPVHGDAATVVGNLAVPVRGQLHRDSAAVPGHDLVHAVVDHLVHAVVQPGQGRVADVHGGALADRLQPLESPDLGGGVLVAVSCGRRQEDLVAFSLRSCGRRRGILVDPGARNRGPRKGRRNPVSKVQIPDPASAC